MANFFDQFDTAQATQKPFTTADVGAAVRGDLFNSPGLPISYAVKPGQTFGQSATANAQPFQNIVAHHTGSSTLGSALNTAQRGDPFRSGVNYGYHFYIDTDGSITQGAPLDARTNHVKPATMPQRSGRMDIDNSNSVGVSFVGTGGQPNAQQLAAAENLSRSLMDRYGIPAQNVVGHGEIQRDRQSSEGMALVNQIRNGGQPVQVAQRAGVVSDAMPEKPAQPQPFVPQRPDSVADAPFVPQRPDSGADKPAGNFFDQFDPKPKPDIGRGKALYEGLRSGATANFGDELAGASAASGLPSWVPEVIPTPAGPIPLKTIMGGAKAIGEYLAGRPGQATAAYEAARDQVRSDYKTAQEQYPGTTIAGNVAGALMLPAGPALQGATLPARMARGAAVGAAYGGVSGAGEGENLTDRASRGTTGAIAGGLIGGIAPPIVETAIQGVSRAVAPMVNAVRGAINPADEAARRVATAVQRDARADPNFANRLTPQEFVGSGGEARLIDMGGETTKALARSAANTSPEGRTALNNTINDRFEGQTNRVTDWLRGAFNYPNAQAQQDAIQQTARTVNRPAYARAYSDPAAQSLWDEGFQQLTAAPVVQEAIRQAARTGANKAAADGFRQPRNPFQFAEDGTMTLRDGMTPSLQFWDAVKRNLDDRINVLTRAGERESARDAQQLRSAMVNHLDELVPSYRQARAGAAHFFQAENALEAGQNYVMQNFATPQVRQALARMSPQERQLFQDGFVSRYIETLERSGDRRNVLNQIASSPAAREKLTVALGPQRAAELEARLRVEGIMDLARSAVQGNSTTARQLAELGFAGGTAGVGALGVSGAYNMDPTQVTLAAVSGALLAGKRGVDTRLARHVAEMLVSNNPAQVQRGVQLLARNNRLMDSLRGADSRIARVGGQEAPKGALVQIPGASRAEDDKPNVPRVPPN